MHDRRHVCQCHAHSGPLATRSLTMPRRKGPWISWLRPCGKRAFWHSTKVRLLFPPISMMTHPSFPPDLSQPLFSPKRDGQPPPGDRGRQFAALCCVRCLETHHLAVRTALIEGDRCGGRDGGSRERRPCEPGGDVQGADAGPVRESVRQASARRREGDVGPVGASEGHHARLLGASAFFKGAP
jgi:hypothetical protein